jgi:hypothetical protein
MNTTDKRKYLHLAKTLLIFFTASIVAPAQTNRLKISSIEKASIVSSILKSELSGKGLSYAGQTIYLSTDNIVDALSTGLIPSKLVILTPERIQEVGSQKKGFVYLRFSKLEVKGGKGLITLVQDTIKDGSQGTIYECRRSGQWICNGIKGFNVSS